jgi:hypothetical protein
LNGGDRLFDFLQVAVGEADVDILVRHCRVPDESLDDRSVPFF